MIDPDGCGDYYTQGGTWLGQDKYTNDNKAYTASGVTKDKSGVVTGAENSNLLNISNSELHKQAAIVYGESSAYKSGKSEELMKEMYAIASVLQRNNEAYGVSNAGAGLYRSKSNEERNGTKMEFATGAVINAVSGGYDYSNGATGWDGQDQAMFTEDNKKFRDKIGSRSIELHKNTIGWSISDADYSKWKSNVGKSFKAPQISFTPTGNGKFNKYYLPNTIRFKSTAVYGGTIFWKELKGKAVIKGK